MHDILNQGGDPKNAALRMMESWVAAMADQIRNPVAGLVAAAGIIEREIGNFRSQKIWNPDLVEQALSQMQARLVRFDHYMAELSGFTKPIILSPEPVDLREVWDHLHSHLVRKMPTEVAVDLYCEPGSEVFFADLEVLKRMLSILVLNSIEACGSEIFAKVSIQSRSLYHGSTVTKILSVRDNGPGFSEAALTSGLAPFFTTKVAGTGLGLALADRYMKAHNGLLTLSNIASKSGAPLGASVELHFPTNI